MMSNQDALTEKHRRLTNRPITPQQVYEAQMHLSRLAMTGYHESANSTVLPEETTNDEEQSQDSKQLIQRENPQAHRKLKPKRASDT